MTGTQILIVAKDHEAGQAYADALNRIGVPCDIATSFDEMSCLAMEKAYSGLMVDLLTLVRSSKEEKVIAYECFNLFPVMRVKWENKKKKINLSPLEQMFSPDAEAALRFFVENRCKPFVARSLRKHNRKNYHLNLHIYRDGTFSEESSIKSFTLNLSRAGAFLHTLQEFEPGHTLWLRFVEYADLAPIAVTVRWSLAWGESRCVPGVGVRFDQLSQAQDQAMKAISSG